MVEWLLPSRLAHSVVAVGQQHSEELTHVPGPRTGAQVVVGDVEWVVDVGRKGEGERETVVVVSRAPPAVTVDPPTVDTRSWGRPPGTWSR